MTKFSFLSILEEEMDKHLTFDYVIGWNKENHTVGVTFILKAQNQSVVETVDDQGEISNNDIIFEDYVLFYNQVESKVDEDDCLMTIPLDAEKGFSRELLTYFAETLNNVTTKGLDDLMDFLADKNATGSTPEWNAKGLGNGKTKLRETEYFTYPRY